MTETQMETRTQPSTAEIHTLKCFVAGDLSAFETLFRQHQAQVYEWIVRIVRDTSSAKDFTMKRAVELFFRIALLTFSWFLWWRASNTPLSNIMNLSIIVGGILLVFPLVWLGKEIFDRHPTPSAVAWITTFVQFAAHRLTAVSRDQEKPGLKIFEWREAA